MRLLLSLALLLPLPAAALTIDAPTVWRGEMRFAEAVRVAAGAVLTVEPGTVVHFSGGGLEVAGRLQAQGARFTGERWPGVVLKGVDGQTRLTDCVIDGADTGIEAIGGAPLLEKLHLHGNRIGVQLGKKTGARLAGCRIENNDRAGLIVKDEAAPAIDNNRFAGNGLFGAYIVHARPRSFTGNRFVGNPTGLKISNFGSDPDIVGNRFENNDVGILVDKAARPTLTANELTGNGTALHLYRRADPRVTGNRLRDNQIGILIAFSSYPRIEGNDFIANELAVKLEFQSSAWEARNGAAARQAETGPGVFGQAPRRDVGEAERAPAPTNGLVDARGNWWGPAGTEELATVAGRENPSFIHDGRDTPTFNEGGKDYPLDRVTFAPWRSTAATGEPSHDP